MSVRGLSCSRSCCFACQRLPVEQQTRVSEFDKLCPLPFQRQSTACQIDEVGFVDGRTRSHRPTGQRLIAAAKTACLLQAMRRTMLIRRAKPS